MKRKTEQLTQGQKTIRSFFFAPRSTEATKENNSELQINVENTLPAEDNVVETNFNAKLKYQATELKDETAEAQSLHPSPANQESPPSSPLPSPHKKAAPQQLQPPQQPQPSQSPSDGINPYERQRLERIKRNAQVMAQLGLLQSAAALAAECSGPSSQHPNTKKPPVRKNKKKGCKDEQTHGPVRRSSRNLGTFSHPNNNNNNESSGQQNTYQHQREASPQLVFQNSNVHTYVCQLFHQISSADNDTSNKDDLSSYDDDNDDYVISTFAKLRPTMYDASLSKAYALDWQPAGGLIAAGGKDGMCAIFGSSASGNDNDDDLVTSLMSSKLHKGWISDVQFVSSSLSSSSSSQYAATTITPMSRLITAGNDGVVSLWDLGQSTANKNNNHNNNPGIPQQVAESSIIHGGHGIFSLHHTANGRIVTGSKDWSVVVSGLYQGSSSIKVVQRYDDVHEGVVKCVRWRSNNNSNEQQEEEYCFASCGNDHKIAITDTRESTTSTNSTKAAIAIVDSHSTAINSLRWHPSNPNLLLTASHDPHILIHDLRNTTLPLFTLTGHILPSMKRIPHIYQPTWVAGGDAVATPGASNTALVVYCAQTGEAVSQGEVVGLAGGQIGLIGCRGAKKDDPLVCVTNKHVHLLKPRFERSRSRRG